MSRGNMSGDSEHMSAQWPPIPEFFSGRSVFITGGTGFLGKALIEKILWSCPNVREIFVLIRPKNGVSVEDRWKKLRNMQVFERVRQRNPGLLDKLVPIIGHIAEEGLGLSPEDRQVLIERVSIIFHTAANVKFDDSIKHAVFVNTRSTRDICILGASMKNLLVLVHVSSTYTQTDKPVVEEIYYDPQIDWKKLIKQMETCDQNVLDTITSKYIHPMPNTYTFSKRVAEKIVHDFSKDIPCVLLRPSIVISSVEEPMVGWLDNLNGPVGIMIASAKGILRALYVKTDVTADYIPVDITMKIILTAAWKRAMVTITQDPELHVYNCAASKVRMVTYGDVSQIGFKQNAQCPIDKPLWYPSCTATNCYVYYYILAIVFHILPALAIDQILKMRGLTPRLLKLQRKIYISNMTLAHFLRNTWMFKNEKCMNLLRLHEGKDEAFYFDFSKLHVDTYLRMSIIGVKKYFLHEDINKIEDSKKYLNKLYWIRAAKNVLLIALFVGFLMQFNAFPYKTAVIGGVCLIPLMQH